MRLTDKCLIKVYYPQENRFTKVEIPCKIYGFLAIHRHHDGYGAYEYAITHIPTDFKLPVSGSKRLLRQFCCKYGKNPLLWDSIDYMKKVKNKQFQSVLIELFEKSGLSVLYPGIH